MTRYDDADSRIGYVSLTNKITGDTSASYYFNTIHYNIPKFTFKFYGTKNHILNGSKSARKDTTLGHSWKELFEGRKPHFEEIRPYLEKVFNEGIFISKTYHIGGGKL